MGELINFTFANHKNLLYEGLWNCFQSNFETNFSLSDRNEGYTKIHAVLFAIFCPTSYLNWLKTGSAFNMSSYGVDLDDEDVKTLVEFIYRGNVGIKAEKLSVVKSGAQVLGLIDLVNQIENYQKTKEPLTRNYKIKQHDNDLLRNLLLKTNDSSVNVLMLEKATLGSVEKVQDETSKDRDSGEEKSESTRGTSKSEDDNLKVERKPVVRKRWDPKPRSKRIITLSAVSNSDEQKPKFTIKWVSRRRENITIEKNVCKHCGKSFKCPRLFSAHVSCHKDPSLKHKCELCEYEAVNKKQLRPHMAAVHHIDRDGNKLEKNIKCPECSFTCVLAFQLNNHRLQAHAKLHKCEVCGYRTSSPAAIKRHVEGVHHVGERNYSCDSCGYKAKTLQVLKNHAKMHEGKKMVCSYCGQVLAASSFDKHVKLHTNDSKPHECHLCKFASRRSYALKVHLKNVHKMETEQIENKQIGWLD